MPSELEDLIEFLHHGNTQIRQVAVEHLVGYSATHSELFKKDQLLPVKDLKLLVKDYAPISKNALTILINISDDQEVLECLAKDEPFLELLLGRITSTKEPNANEIAMLLANMAKSDDMQKVLQLQRDVPKELSTSKWAMDQLLDCFVKGAEGRYNKSADYDYLSYFFADLAKFPKGREYLTAPQPHDNNIIPLTKLIVFTEHASEIRRRGVASAIKNCAFDIHVHDRLLSDSPTDGVNLLPYILLPIMGGEEYSDEDTEGMLDDLQLLPPDKEREKETDIIKTHVETLTLLTTTRGGRDVLRRVKVYPIVRETHIHVDDDEVREACDRLVQVIMRGEEGEGEGKQIEANGGDDGHGGKMMALEADESEDEDEQIIDIL